MLSDVAKTPYMLWTFLWFQGNTGSYEIHNSISTYHLLLRLCKTIQMQVFLPKLRYKCMSLERLKYFRQYEQLRGLFVGVLASVDIVVEMIY